MKKIYRSRKNKLIAGVCGGLAEYFGADYMVTRIIVGLLCWFTSGIGLIAYLVAAFMLPVAPEEGFEVYDDPNYGGSGHTPEPTKMPKAPKVPKTPGSWGTGSGTSEDTGSGSGDSGSGAGFGDDSSNNTNNFKKY